MKLDTEFSSALTAKVAWEAVGRVRVSNNFQQIGTYGNYLVKTRTHDLLSLPACDEHRFFTYELEMNDQAAQMPGDMNRLPPSSHNQTHMFVQTALLYTSSEGERRIRVHNLAYSFTSQPSECYEELDMNELISFEVSKAVGQLDVVPNFVGTRSFIQLQFQNISQAVSRIY